MSTLPKLIVILGPTASGKTSLSLELAKKFKGEIVNADSRQIYKGMDIGTGKVVDKKSVKHYLLDVIDPDEEFTLVDYKKKAVAAIRDILKRGKTPFLVGGTGLYIQAIVDNLEIPAVPPNKKLRAQFEKEIKKPGALAKWYKKLLKIDPGAAFVVDKNNPRRIIRALEVCLATGRQFSKLREKGEPLFEVLQIGISIPRKKLYENIDRRVDQMMKDGLVTETKKLVKKFQVPSSKFQELPSMSGIGYKEMGEYLGEKLKVKSEKLRKKILENKIQEIKWRTHAYARRQMTWFRRDKRIKWIKNYKEAKNKIGKWLK
ncbi:tRNA (adenosine(37)-N6)-dimethylallyltransferase MiaA [Candidatus Falkowbacteria bacterium]|nr:tRNA (adenosine(37)-N6)-dimethylallyltransferase MiaA [Candidatus Falkowbacteria bacterium]